MHTLLVAVSLIIAGLSGYVCLRLLDRICSWDTRRSLQITGMLVPVAVMGILALTLVHFISEVCWMMAPPTDVALTQGFSAAGVVAIVLAFLVNALRAVLLPLHLRRHTWEAPGWLRKCVADVGDELGMAKPPQVRVSADRQPWALVAGPLQPHLVVSSGLAALLNQEELRAVLCHELLHIRRADLWWSALAGALRDLTWFLPATRRLHRDMLAEQELACDDHVVGDAQRLALAGALARVWQARVSFAPAPRGSLALARDPSDWLETRMRRLLDQPGMADERAHRRALLVSFALLGLFVAAQLGAITLAMRSMGCV